MPKKAKPAKGKEGGGGGVAPMLGSPGMGSGEPANTGMPEEGTIRSVSKPSGKSIPGGPPVGAKKIPGTR